MVLGSNMSGFGWNPDECILTATDDVWNEYLKTHKNASLFKDKPFPLYHKLSTIFGKDRVTGSRAVDLGDEEIVDETQETTTADLEYLKPKIRVSINLEKAGVVQAKNAKEARMKT